MIYTIVCWIEECLRNFPKGKERYIVLTKTAARIDYLNGIVVASRTACNYTNYVEQVTPLLQIEGVTLKLKKLSFFTEKTNYICYFMRPRPLEVVTHTIDAIKELRLPTNITGMCSLLRACSVCCCFVHGFECIAARSITSWKETSRNF